MTHDPVEILRERFLEGMRAAFGDDLPPDADPLISESRQREFGDFQSNAAMSLGKRLGMKPRDAAQRIVEHVRIEDIAEPLGEASIAGPGFINIRLRAEALREHLRALEGRSLGIDAPDERQRIVVDLCGVNLAKQMHVGHLRSTIIGDALARVLERLGHDVVRQNHFGDWGLPIAMVTDVVKRRVESGELDLNALTLDDLDGLYRESQRACAADRGGLAAVEKYDLGPKARAELEAQVESAEEAMKRAKETLVALQSREEKTLHIWQRIAQITIETCVAVCGKLQSNVAEEHTAGESTYSAELAPLIHDLEERGVAEESQGALIVRLDDYGIAEPLLVRKSDGGFLYATSDLAGIRRRVQEIGASRVIYAVDARQSLHFRQVFAAARKAGYATLPDGREASLEHAVFGTMLGEDGRPFKTRSGENVKLSDLIDEAITRAERIVKEKNPALSDKERRAVAEAVGVGAVKYADLSSDRVKDYVFSFDRMLAFEGNTGPYLQYALVRIRSILRKARSDLGLPASHFDEGGPLSEAPFSLDSDQEKTLALQLLRFPGALQGVAETLEPHRLCTYLFDLSTAFSSFFENCPVLRAETEAVRDGRLRLCRVTERVLDAGLRTLGLTPLEQM